MRSKDMNDSVVVDENHASFVDKDFPIKHGFSIQVVLRSSELELEDSLACVRIKDQELLSASGDPISEHAQLQSASRLSVACGA